jgi:hypothetical protein
MKRVLSLLLLIPFLVTQSWAMRGGPYDSPLGNSQAALSGTYGIALQGVQGAGEVANPDALSTTGALAVSVPTSGLVTGRVLIFDKGLMYIGAGQGLVDPRSGSMKLLAQASHYSLFNANTTSVAPMVDYILSGQVNLNLNVDYFSGLIVATGDAVFASYDTFPESVQQTSVTTTSTSNTGTTGDGVTTQTSANGTTVKRENVATIIEPDGSTTTVTTTTTGPDSTSTKNSNSNATQTGQTTSTVANNDVNLWHGNTPVSGGSLVQGSNTVVVDSTASLRVGMTVSGQGIPSGTTIVDVIDGTTVQLSKPAISTGSGITLKANSSSVVFLRMTADGLREDTMITALPVLAPPSQANNYQIGIATGAAGGGGAATGGGGAGA